jgi:hypothetical protein
LIFIFITQKKKPFPYAVYIEIQADIVEKGQLTESRYELFDRKRKAQSLTRGEKKHTNCVINAGWDAIMSCNNFTLM